MDKNPRKASSGETTRAAEKPASQAPTISLPKGGGAVRGIGEKFSVNPVTGTGSLSVPIFTSPGRSGFHPALSLSYDSGAGNGPFGFGWHISVPSITRKTDKGLPRYFDGDASDVFLLSDAEDLMPVLSPPNGPNDPWAPVTVQPGAWAGQDYIVERYRPRIEGLFARIERWRRNSDGDTHWRAVTKSNVTSIYGFSTDCRIADPADQSRVFQWPLETTFDDKGNVIYYEYKAEDSTGINAAVANERNRRNGNAPCTNLYLKRIHYGNQTPYTRGEDLSQRKDWLVEVVFDYGEHPLSNPSPAEDPNLKWATRADPFSHFRSTFDIRTYRLCQRVLLFHHFPPGQKGETGYDGLVRSTDFHYDQSDPSSSLLGNPIATKLISITQTGYMLGQDKQSYLPKSLPPLEFTYSEAEVDPTVRTVDPGSLENTPLGANGSNYQWLDLDGEGLTGILTEQAGGMFYKRNLSPINTITENGASQTLARFGPLELVASEPAPVAAGGKSQFMDLAADGRQDRVNLIGPVRGYYERTDVPTWQSLSPFRSFPNLDTRDPNLKMVDINGDGLTDLLVSENEVFAWYQSLGYDGFGSREFAPKPLDEEKGAALVFKDSTQSIFLADMTGDGLSDVVRIRNGEVCYWPNRGYGRFGAKVVMDNSPQFDTPDLFDPRRVRLTDIDGSGTADLLYLAARGVAIYRNQSGNSWSAETLLPNLPPINDVTSVNTVDLLGNGTACLVWSSPLPSDAGRQMRYIDLTGNQKPHLLIAVKNNLGAETRIRYASSTKFYVQDREAGTPWVTKLAFSVYVVERAEIFDYIGRTRLVTTYHYRHGYFDGVEREFRGFGYVEQRDAESIGDSGSLFTEDSDQEADALHLPPVVTKTWFHTGAWPDEETVIHHMAHEYFGASDPADQHFSQEWPLFTGALLPDPPLPTDVFVLDPAQPDGTNRLQYSLTGGEQREAVRALKGSILRQEIYAYDGTDKAKVPYSVSERNYTVECLQPQGSNRYAVFFTHARETMDYHLERNPADPRVTHKAVLKVDPFGNVLRSISVAYGRNLKSSGVKTPPATTSGEPTDLTKDASTFAQLEQLTALIKLTENTFATAPPGLGDGDHQHLAIDTPDAYRTPVRCEACTYELTRPSRQDDSAVYSFDDLETLAVTAVAIAYEVVPDLTKTQKRLIEDVRTLYLKDDLSGPMDAGQMDTLGFVYETYKLAFTAALAQQVFISGNSNPNKPADVTTLKTLLSGDGGYVNSQEDTNWWIPSVRTLYSPVPQNPPNSLAQDATYAATHFYLPQAHRDPFGHYTRLTYDSYDFLLQQKQDALGNTVFARNDYRVLQPREIIDPNANHTVAAFDPLGLVIGTAIQGKVTADKPESGDSVGPFFADLPQEDINGFIGNANPLSAAPNLLGTATSRFIYDLEKFRESQSRNPEDPTKWQPNFAATIVRETHVADVPADQPNKVQVKVQVSFSYSDGFGRVIQRKIQAEPGPLDLSDQNAPVISPRWVGSGWTILNNKAKPVRKYEPFFSATHDFEFARRVGVTSTLLYDPLERVIATLHPNHTWEKVVFDPWRQRTWDVNDTVQMDPKTDPNVGNLFNLLPEADNLPTWYQTRTDPTKAAAAFPDLGVRAAEQDAANKAVAHNDTPVAKVFDVLARQFLSVTHNRYQKNGSTVDKFDPTHIELDIEGNRRSFTDALGRVVMRYDYDMLGNRVHQASMEAGERWHLRNVMRKAIRSWDSRGFVRTIGYDELHRRVALNVTGNGLNHILAEKTVYGDSRQGGPANPEQTNHRTRVYRAYDAAGIVTNLGANPATSQNEGYDFKGNLLRSSRRLIKAYKHTPDWSAIPAPGMEDETFVSATRYDALNRPIQIISPHSDQPGTKVNVIRPGYNDAALQERVDVWLAQDAELKALLVPNTADEHTVANIDYNARGQRVRIKYGNGAVSTYTYDPHTFRLIELKTTRPAPDQADATVTNLFPNSTVVQNLQYAYDPAGNITRLEDRALKTVVYNGQTVKPVGDYTYDAVYRLIEAAGRESIGQMALNTDSAENLRDYPFAGIGVSPADAQALRNYREQYDYDDVGNILQTRHQVGTGSWARIYNYDELSLTDSAQVNNRLSSTETGSMIGHYTYDTHGNMLSMPHLPKMQWDYHDRLQATARQVRSDGGTPETTYYVYGVSGQRVRKVTDRQAAPAQLPSRRKERIYLAGFEIYREYDSTGNNVTLERQTIHVMDGKQRVALVETQTTGSNPQLPLIRYQLTNHLGSVGIELDNRAQLITYEEYSPYGNSVLQASGNQAEASKRYRYTGKERDEENGLGYHHARYYAPWLGRWSSSDPRGLVDGTNTYAYVRGNPIRLGDPSGYGPPMCTEEHPWGQQQVQLLPTIRHGHPPQPEHPSAGGQDETTHSNGSGEDHGSGPSSSNGEAAREDQASGGSGGQEPAPSSSDGEAAREEQGSGGSGGEPDVQSAVGIGETISLINPNDPPDTVFTASMTWNPGASNRATRRWQPYAAIATEFHGLAPGPLSIEEALSTGFKLGSAEQHTPVLTTELATTVRYSNERVQAAFSAMLSVEGEIGPLSARLGIELGVDTERGAILNINLGLELDIQKLYEFIKKLVP